MRRKHYIVPETIATEVMKKACPEVPPEVLPNITKSELVEVMEKSYTWDYALPQ